jgi:hypothetical protein
MALNYSTIITQIDTILKTATGIVAANVYTYDRLETTDKGFSDAFKNAGTSLINAWTITRAKVENIPEATRTSKIFPSWIIRGYYSLGSSGSTETAFQGIIDNIFLKFESNPKLNSTVLTSSLQIDTIEPRMFGSVLVHFVEMRLVSEHESSYT